VKKTGFALLAGVLLVLAGGVAYAAGLEWRDHAAPFSFLFGNHIDAHQQSRVKDGNLQGFFYIQLTGGHTTDGIPVAMHGDCTMSPDACVAGWSIMGVPTTALLAGLDSMGHPLWCVDASTLAKRPGYSHFHWLGAPEHAGELDIGQEFQGYLLQLRAIDTFYFMEHGGSLVTPGIDTTSHYNITTDCN